MGLSVDKCGSCVFKAQDGQNKTVCRLAHWPINLAEDGCTKHQRSASQCDYCGNIVADNSQLIYNNGRLICTNCYQHLGHCPTCTKASRTCNLNDSSFEPSIPPQIQKTVKQGPSTFVTVVPNPERIEKACKPCSCWNSSENICGRQNNYCNKYDEL